LPWFPEAASSYAADIDWLFAFITIIVGVWFIAAEALLVYLIVRYRRREGRRAAYLPARSLRTMAFVLVPCAIILCLDLVIDAVAAPVWDEIKLTLPPHDELVREDVLHSFFIPTLRLKQDAVPGRTIRGWFRPTREGRYEVPCAEICGFAHTMMKANLFVESEDAYREWLESKAAEAQAAPGPEGKQGG
jgi:cytochrome c oxidase subunit 2